MGMQSVDDTINTLIRSYFKRKRRESGLTGKELGRLLCISQQQVSRYERGETAIPLSTMVFFLKSNNFDLNDFFYYLLEGIYVFYEKIDGSHCESIFPQSFLHLTSKGFFRNANR